MKEQVVAVLSSGAFVTGTFPKSRVKDIELRPLEMAGIVDLCDPLTDRIVLYGTREEGPPPAYSVSGRLRTTQHVLSRKIGFTAVDFPENKRVEIFSYSPFEAAGKISFFYKVGDVISLKRGDTIYKYRLVARTSEKNPSLEFLDSFTNKSTRR